MIKVASEARFFSDARNLPTLATRAAVELDVMSRGRKTAANAVRTIGELLSNSTMQKAESCSHPACLLDPPSIVLVARALQTTKRDFGPTPEEVCKATAEIARQLREAAEVGGSALAPILRDFCVALARGVSRREVVSRLKARPRARR